MKAILTKYHGPTNSRGARIIASEPDGKRVSIPYPHELNTDDAHQMAAQTLADKLGWKGRLVGGGLKSGNCYVFVD